MAGTDFNFTSEHVQKEIENGEYISTESTVLLAGPSQLTFTEGINEQGSAKYPLFPIGLVGSFSFDQTRDVNRLYEVGSKRAYFIPNRLRGDFTMARTLFYGPSLMRLLYALAPIETAGKWGNKLKDNENNTPRSPKYEALFAQDQTRIIEPGSGGLTAENQNRDFWMNLMSELFNVPFGLAVYFRDSKNRGYAAMYMEDAYIQNHRFSVETSTVFLSEAVQGTFDRLSPFQSIVTGV